MLFRGLRHDPEETMLAPRFALSIISSNLAVVCIIEVYARTQTPSWGKRTHLGFVQQLDRNADRGCELSHGEL